MGFTVTIAFFFLLLSMYCERFKKCYEDPKFPEFLRDNILSLKTHFSSQRNFTKKYTNGKRKKTFFNVHTNYNFY